MNHCNLPRKNNTALLLLQASGVDDAIVVAARSIKHNIQDIRENVRELTNSIQQAAGGRFRGVDGRNYTRMLSQESSDTDLYPTVQLDDRRAEDSSVAQSGSAACNHTAADEL